MIQGEGCYETPDAASVSEGDTRTLPAATAISAVFTESTRRHVLAVIVHADSNRIAGRAKNRLGFERGRSFPIE